MRHLIFTFLSITMMMGILWYIVGSSVLVIGLGLLALVSVIFGAFSLGSWWTHQVMQSGAKIALEAQISDDNRDQIQLRSIANILKDFSMLSRELSKQKPKQLSPQANTYPPRLVENTQAWSPLREDYSSKTRDNEDFIDAEFEVGGMVAQSDEDETI